MSRKTDALKKTLVALGHGSASDYKGETIADVLRELAVVLECAPSVDDIRATKITGILDYITDNYGSEYKEPYDLSIVTGANANVIVKVNGKTTTAGTDKLYKGDKVKVTATADEGYSISTLTVNGTSIQSDDTYVVDDVAVSIIGLATKNKYSLVREVENCTVAVEVGGEEVADGEEALTHGDVLTITATATEGYTLDALKVNGEDFVSGSTLTASGNVTITATASE